MGQAQSVSPKRFQEEYYLFFDEKNTPGKYRNNAARHPTGCKHNDDTLDKKHNVSQAVAESKLVHRGDLGDIFNVSTHNDVLYATTSEGSPNEGSTYDDGALYSDGMFRDDESVSENECTFREYQSPSGRVISGYWNGEEFINGRIKWADGREYNGALKGSVPDGFGAYKTSGGKEYTGYWRKGLQHGAGAYVTEKDGCRIQRRGIWDNGQLVHWFDEEDDITLPDTTSARTIMEEIMATPTATPSLSISSFAPSPFTSASVTPCANKGSMGGT